ncbi:MAG: hypothetical protein ACE15C_05560 [Phycisphaerae bacterium]
MNMRTNSVVALAVILILAGAGVFLASQAAAQAPGSGGPVSGPARPEAWPAGKVVGWRGDGTGRYPDAAPPTEWYQKEDGESKNILWKTKLPCYSWATPVIVGDRLFTLSEPYDLICLDKNSGKVLWIRSFPPVVGVTPDEKKANPAFKEIEPLLAQLQEVNDQFVDKGWTAEIRRKKRDLQLKIDELSGKADEKYALPPDKYVESWSGYTAPTPCSDGQFLYVTSGDGITACYDLDGNRKWCVYESLTKSWGEHGFGCSPAIVGDVLLAPSMSLRALNKATGQEIYRKPIYSGYGILPFRLNGVDFATTAGNYFRVRDGRIVVPRVGDMPSGMTVMNGDMVYYGGGHISYVKVAPKGEDELTVTPLIPGEYNRVTLPTAANPESKHKIDGTIAGFYTASPLYDNGLLYYLGNSGRLVVADATKTAKSEVIVYTCFPPFDFKNGFGRKTYGFGLCASPALAGKHIYMIDSAGCTIVMEPGREYKQVAKNVIEQTVDEQQPNTFGAKSYWHGPHQEQTVASLVFDGGRIYIRGEQFMYCVGQK